MHYNMCKNNVWNRCGGGGHIVLTVNCPDGGAHHCTKCNRSGHVAEECRSTKRNGMGNITSSSYLNIVYVLENFCKL